MKARDVVAGWPRGRSTSVFERWGKWPWWFNLSSLNLANSLMYVDAYGDGIYGEERQRLVEQYAHDLDRFKVELGTDLAYHASQQRMVDEYRCGCSTIGYLARETQSGILVVIPNELIGIAYAVEPNSSAGVFINLSRGVVR